MRIGRCGTAAGLWGGCGAAAAVGLWGCGAAVGRLWGDCGAVGRLPGYGEAAGRLRGGCGAAARWTQKRRDSRKAISGRVGGHSSHCGGAREAQNSSKINWFISPPYPTHEDSDSSESLSSLSEVSRHVHSLSQQLRDLSRSYQALSETIFVLRSHLEPISARVGRLEEAERVAEIRFIELSQSLCALESACHLHSLD